MALILNNISSCSTLPSLIWVCRSFDGKASLYGFCLFSGLSSGPVVSCSCPDEVRPPNDHPQLILTVDSYWLSLLRERPCPDAPVMLNLVFCRASRPVRIQILGTISHSSFVLYLVRCCPSCSFGSLACLPYYWVRSRFSLDFFFPLLSSRYCRESQRWMAAGRITFTRQCVVAYELPIVFTLVIEVSRNSSSLFHHSMSLHDRVLFSRLLVSRRVGHGSGVLVF